MTSSSPAPETNTLVVEYWPNRRWRSMNNLAGMVICLAIWWAPHGFDRFAIPVTLLMVLATVFRTQTHIYEQDGMAQRVFTLLGRWPVIRLRPVPMDSFQYLQCKLFRGKKNGRHWDITLQGQDGKYLGLQSREDCPTAQAKRIVADARALAERLGMPFRLAGQLQLVGMEPEPPVDPDAPQAGAEE